jgi:hypothetical protein
VTTLIYKVIPTSRVKLPSTDGSPENGLLSDREHVREFFAALSRRSLNCHSIMLPSPSACILGNLIHCSRDACWNLRHVLIASHFMDPPWFLAHDLRFARSLSLTGFCSVPIWSGLLSVLCAAASVGSGHSGRFEACYDAWTMLCSIKCLGTRPSWLFALFFCIIFLPFSPSSGATLYLVSSAFDNIYGTSLSLFFPSFVRLIDVLIHF